MQSCASWVNASVYLYHTSGLHVRHPGAPDKEREESVTVRPETIRWTFRTALDASSTALHDR